MIEFNNIHPDDYFYELPESRIAWYPVEKRDESKLLIREQNGELKEDRFFNIANYLFPHSHLFFNNSKVIPARIVFRKETGAEIEIFCLKPYAPSDYSKSLSSTTPCEWECLIGNQKKFKARKLSIKIFYKNKPVELCAEKMQDNIIRFSWDDPHLSFAEMLALTGHTPLPPYIKREDETIDRIRYQNIYSKYEGSVAAPTAGLHFTDEVFQGLSLKNITLHEVTLHVGAGTFQPIKSNNIMEHEMHAEFFEINLPLLKALSVIPGPVTSVGTTTVRSLESIYWLGVKIMYYKNHNMENLALEQWECYTLPQHYTLHESVESIINWLDKKGLTKTMASTRLLIVPGYAFKTTRILVTNFHQPKSTLLLLIAAFIGQSWKETYAYALKNNFRFLSYGDSSLLFH